METTDTQKTFSLTSVFGKRYLDGNALYIYLYGTLPSVHFRNGINGEKAYEAFAATFAHLITGEHQFRCFDKQRKRYEFDSTFLALSNHSLVEFNGWYREILHDGKNAAFIEECTQLLNRFKERTRRKPLEINLIVRGNCGLELRSMEIKRTKLDVGLFYNDDFKDVDVVIRERLNRKKDKGIVLLHGMPGTGKTTYIRYLVGRIKKRVLFLSANVASNLMDPDFIDLLIENPDTVLVIEDAENILMDRRLSWQSSVSNLLNISDGLLADFLNVQIICSFNNPLTMIDSALMRKERLIARYEFGKLEIEKAGQLSRHLGNDREIDRPMTLAEICHANEKEVETKQFEVIGFRKLEIRN